MKRLILVLLMMIVAPLYTSPPSDVWIYQEEIVEDGIIIVEIELGQDIVS